LPGAIVTAAYIGAPDREFATARCGTEAPIATDAAVINLCFAKGAPRLAPWLVWTQVPPALAAAQIERVN
jgi:hypothetical protein